MSYSELGTLKLHTAKLDTYNSEIVLSNRLFFVYSSKYSFNEKLSYNENNISPL